MCSAAPLLLSTSVYSNFMRQQAMSSRMLFNRPAPVNRLVGAIADSESFATPILWVHHSQYADRGASEHSRVRSPSIRCRSARDRPGQTGPPPLRVLSVRQLVRILRHVHRRAVTKCEDLPREALRELCRLYVPPALYFPSQPSY